MIATTPLRKTTASSCCKSVLRTNAIVATTAPAATLHSGRQRHRFHHLATWDSNNNLRRATPRPRGRPGGGALASSLGIGPADDRDRGFVDRVRRSRFSSVAGDAPPGKSLKRVIRPFLMACHPDAMAAEAEAIDGHRRERHPLSQRAKAVNLAAVQTVNGLIDAVDDLVGRCTPPSYHAASSTKEQHFGAGSLPELKARYEIEFILPSTENSMDSKPAKRKHRDREPLTLRSVTVSFPEQLRKDVKKWALTSFPANNYSGEPHPREEEAFGVATQLKNHALEEFLRLLSIAGMQAPASSVDDVRQGQRRQQEQGQQRKEEGQWTLTDHFLHELGIDPNCADVTADPTPLKPKGQSLAFFGRTRAQPSRTAPKSDKAPPPQYKHPHMQKERQKFMDSIPWNKFQKDYDRAFQDAKADWTTSRLKLYDASTSEGRGRREEFVSQICGRVRIWRASTDGADANEGDIGEDEIPEGLGVAAQLVALRRLSLILYENFDKLEMEEMGRMWERLVIVLTPPRESGPSGRERKETDRPSFSRQGRRKKLSKWERRMKARERLDPGSRGKMRYLAEASLAPKGEEDDADREEARASRLESGFKFSYGTGADQGTGRVTAHVPVDFREGELVDQLVAHVREYFDAVCGYGGFLRYGADGKVVAAAGGEEGAGAGRGNDEGAGGQRERRMDAE